ncbi:MAG: glutathione S-transferase family protein [Alphaproteobacteria bacterium]
MIKLYYAPRTRAVRILWLLEELGLPYELARVEFKPTTERFFIQDTPTGKLPTIEDGDVVMAESGAIIEYLLETYGEGRLAPPPGSPARAAYLQWFHFAESTAFPPMGIVVWLTVYRTDAAKHPEVIADATIRAQAGLDQVEKALAGNDYILGPTFTAADIMLGFTLYAAQILNLMDARQVNIAAYLQRLMARPALQKAMAA